MDKVREAEQNARKGVQQHKGVRPKYLNDVKIDWPPKTSDFLNLCKAMNLKVTEKQAIEALVSSKVNGKFSFEKLINWFQ